MNRSRNYQARTLTATEREENLTAGEGILLLGALSAVIFSMLPFVML